MTNDIEEADEEGGGTATLDCLMFCSRDVASHFPSKVKGAYEAYMPKDNHEYYGELELELIHELALAKLLTMTSADVNTADVEAITSALHDYRNLLVSLSKAGRQLPAIEAAAISTRAEWSESMKSQEYGYVNKLQKAAERGLESFDIYSEDPRQLRALPTVWASIGSKVASCVLLGDSEL